MLEQPHAQVPSPGLEWSLPASSAVIYSSCDGAGAKAGTNGLAGQRTGPRRDAVWSQMEDQDVAWCI